MLGREVCRAVVKYGLDLQRSNRRPTGDGIVFDAERDDPNHLFRTEVAVAVNCAAVLAADIAAGGAAAAEHVNARFPHDLVDAARSAGARVIHISTDGVFADDAGVCSEESTAFSTDLYGLTKRTGEPDAPNALTVRASFVGRDPTRRRGLIEWLLAQPEGASIPGFTDQCWNGLVSTQLAEVCAALADESVFGRARTEGAVHHLFEDPPLTKGELLDLCREAFSKDVTVFPTQSGRPVARVLTTVHSTLRELLESRPERTVALRELSERDEGAEWPTASA